MEDLYQDLGVTRTASVDEIKSAFKRKAKETHPDLHGGGSDYEARFRKVAEAYAILSDTKKRAEYDATNRISEQFARNSAEDIKEAIRAMHAMVEPYKKQARKYIYVGLAWLLGGITVTLLSLSAADMTGGYVITWGAILFGGIQAGIGFYRYGKMNEAIEMTEKQMWDDVF